MKCFFIAMLILGGLQFLGIGWYTPGKMDYLNELMIWIAQVCSVILFYIVFIKQNLNSININMRVIVVVLALLQAGLVTFILAKNFSPTLMLFNGLLSVGLPIFIVNQLNIIRKQWVEKKESIKIRKSFRKKKLYKILAKRLISNPVVMQRLQLRTSKKKNRK